MLRAIDRLKEAEFFLAKVIKSESSEVDDWRYYFNALAHATRSISLVLQKDLRPFYGKDFDAWWDEQKKVILSQVSFVQICNLRNIIEKEGSRYPLIVLEVELSNCIFSVVRIELELSLGHKGITYRKFVLSKETFEVPDVPGETPKETGARLEEFCRELLRNGVREFWANWQSSEKTIVGFRFPWSEDVVDPGTIVGEFSIYLQGMAQVIRNAQVRFHDLPELIASSCGCPVPKNQQGTG